MGPFGFLRIAVASPRVHVANPSANATEILTICDQAADADILLFPELSVTGYCAADLFHHRDLLEKSLVAIARIAEQTARFQGLVVIGAPLLVEGGLYNTAIVISHGQLVAAIPKSFLPNYREFYECRWFKPAAAAHSTLCSIAGHSVPFGTDILLRYGSATIGIELCEDLWMPIPPSSRQALGGAHVLLNLSASNELVAKADWRRTLVLSQSGRTLAAYAYSSSGPSESTTDLVFSGHCMIAENGSLLAERRDLGPAASGPAPQRWISADIDLQRLVHERIVQNTFGESTEDPRNTFRIIELPSPAEAAPDQWTLRRTIAGQPFVPPSSSDLDLRCGEILSIQEAGLAKRIERLPKDLPLVIGVSGGLDSTLALLVAVRACEKLGWPQSRIHGLTMPGFGTSADTLASAQALMRLVGVSSTSIDIRPLALKTFQDLKHQPFGISTTGLSLDEFLDRLQSLESGKQDLVFENVQARLRTYLLMNRGFVLGTGDLSEQALGWSTYNGDHMSMYNVNTSVPKTLVRFLVRYAADHLFQGELRSILHQIARAPISPELLPLSASGKIVQKTESVLGPYELHDFFLYHFVRFGAPREKILYLAKHATFAETYSSQTIRETLDLFLRRFFSQQFKRSCVPDGPKVGTVSLSPRGDWRMPSDAEVDDFLE